MASIEKILVRRSDLSTFLVHLTRRNDTETARDCLESIITSRRLKARNPFGPTVRKLTSAGLPTDSQKCVCFTETPLEFLYLMLEEVEERRMRFEPYGIAMTKRQGRERGVNPVWYMESEWRVYQEFRLPNSFLGLCPEDEISDFEDLCRSHSFAARFVDPRWDLVRIIVTLVQIPKSYLPVMPHAGSYEKGFAVVAAL